MLLGGGYSGKRSPKQKCNCIFIVNLLRKETFKIRFGLERLSSRFRIKLFQGQTVDLKFPYFGWSRFLCSQQRGPGHLGSMLQENMQRTTNLFFLWLLLNGRWLGWYQSRRYDAAKSRNHRTEGLAGVVELHFCTRYRDQGSLYNSFAYA